MRCRAAWLLGALVAGCAAEPVCPGGGTRVSDGDRSYCAYPAPVVIIGGFDCPAGLPYPIEVHGGIVCADRPVGRDDLPAELCELVGGCEPPPTTQPSNGQWQAIAALETDRFGHRCVAVGERVVAFGGAFLTPAGLSVYVSRPELFAAGRWAPIDERSAPSPRMRAGIVALDERTVAVWGGIDGEGELAGGAVLDLDSGTWSAMSAIAEPAPRIDATMVAVSGRVVVWGGCTEGGVGLGDGALYDPGSGSWTPIAALGSPAARCGHSSVVLDGRVFVWGGRDGSRRFDDGAIYDPDRARWEPVSSDGAPRPRAGACAAWTGEEVVIWGGDTPGGALTSGAAYSPATRTWRSITSTGAPSPRSAPACVWTGDRLVVWGGELAGAPLASGHAYDPERDVWTAMSSAGAPSARADACAVSVDGEAWILGGISLAGSEGHGARWRR